MSLARRGFAASVLVFCIAPPVFAQEAAAPPENEAAPREASEPPPPGAAELARAREALQQIDSLWVSVEGLVADARQSSEEIDDEARQILRVGMIGILQELEDRTGSLLGRLRDADEAGAETDSLRNAAARHLRDRANLYFRAIGSLNDRLAGLRVQRKEATEGFAELEARIADERATLDRAMGWATDTAYALEAADGDAERVFRTLDRILEERAESLAGRLQVTDLGRDRLQIQLKSAQEADASNLSELRSRLQATEKRIEGIAESLGRTIGLLERRGRDTAEYGQVIIQVTGEVTEDILDPRVLLGLAKDIWRNVMRWIADKGPAIAVQLAILLLFVLIFRAVAVVAWWIFRAIWHPRKSQLLRDLLGRIIRPVATFLGFGAGLWFLGVNPTTLLAGVGVAGVIIGFALQDTLSNLASGVFILIYRPYDVDDLVSAGGIEGKVKEMGLANTTILTLDNRRLFVPNSKIWGSVIENRSAEPVRRVETAVRISNHDDLDRALAIIQDALHEHELVLDEPAPSVFVSNFADFWIELGVWTWVKSENVWASKTQIRPFVRARLQENGIQVPFRPTATRDPEI